VQATEYKRLSYVAACVVTVALIGLYVMLWYSKLIAKNS